MIQQQFKELIKLYQRAAAGDPLEEIQLFASAISFLENLKFALQDSDITREAGMAMIELLRQHGEAYERLLESQRKSGINKVSKGVKEVEQKRELKAKLAILARELGEFFRQTKDQVPEKAAPHPLGQVAKPKLKPRRLNRHKWIRS